MADDDYTKALEKGARHLVRIARAGNLPAVHLREAEIKALLDQLGRGRSVLLVGPTGVGKTSVIHGAAKSLAAKGFGAIAEISTVTVLAGTRYLGEWQGKLTKICEAAAATSTILYFSDVHNLPRAGRTSNNDTNFLDALKPFVESGRITMLAEANPETLRAMERVPGFSELFTKVAIEPMTAQQVDTVLSEQATALGLDVVKPALDAMVKLTTRFLPARPQPAPALALIRQVRDYQIQKQGIGEDEPIDEAFIERVFSIYSGLPRFIVSRSETRKAEDIRQWFSERIVGQQEAIEAVVQAIALFKAGLQDPKRPLGTFLFVGPTGVGKTELARAMATFLYGSPHRLLRFDLSEFKDYHSFETLLGSPSRPDEPARLVDPVRAQPFQVVLFDELEKAHQNVWDVLLSLLDEGRLTTPRGQTVDFRSTFLIATSNVGAQDADKQVGFASSEDAERRRQRVWTELEKTFRPEFLGRFQHTALFHPLTEPQVRRIARKELRDILTREGITGRNLVVDVDDEAIELVMKRGFHARWGARAMKQELQRQVVLPLAMTLMERQITAGQVLKVTGKDGAIRVRRLDTAASRETKREQEPIRLAGRSFSRADLKNTLRNLRENMGQLALDADEDFHKAARQRLTELREEHSFWQQPEQAAKTLRDLDRSTMTIDRLDRIRQRIESFDQDLGRSETRERLTGLARRVPQLEDALANAARELVHMGPDGHWDALIEIRPLGEHKVARDVLVDIYRSWAKDRGLELDWLCEPRADDEPAWFAIKGGYAFGLLRNEAGVHKVRDGEAHGAARVRVAAWTDRATPVVYGEHRALKSIGSYGGKIRSRLEWQDRVLQNRRTLAENRDLAVDIAGSWAVAPEAGDGIVRRYDLSAPLVRDTLTGFSSGRPDAVAPGRFHELLCSRIDELSSGPRIA